MEEKDSAHLSSQLLSVLCHDLATPMTVITLNLEKVKFELMALKDYDFGPSMDSIDRSLNAAKKVNSMLSLARDAHGLSSGKLPILSNPISLKQCFLSALQQLESMAKAKNVQFDFLEWPTFDRTFTDENLFTNHILINLLTNAIKFSYRDGKVLISVQKKLDFYMIYISDSGVGIPKEKVPTLFNFSGSTTSLGTENEAGTGYGLPIVKFLIDSIGAEIQVFSKQKSDSSAYSGTLFELKVPYIVTDSSKL